MNKKAVILLSGGLDSATTAAIAIHEKYELHAMTFNYGQRHSVELLFARSVAAFFNMQDHHFIDIPHEIFRSALIAGSPVDVPRNREISSDREIPATYVPARNILFLSYALAYGESIEAGAIFIGANAVDYSGYPDCRPEFFRAYEEMARIGTKTGSEGAMISIETPLLMMKKSEIIKRGHDLGVDYSLTHSCYDPGEDGTSCGVCDSCIIRRKGFHEAGLADPTPYRRT